MRFEAVRGGETAQAIVLRARVRTFSRVGTDVGLEVMASGEGLGAALLNTSVKQTTINKTEQK